MQARSPIQACILKKNVHLAEPGSEAEIGTEAVAEKRWNQQQVQSQGRRYGGIAYARGRGEVGHASLLVFRFVVIGWLDGVTTLILRFGALMNIGWGYLSGMRTIERNLLCS